MAKKSKCTADDKILLVIFVEGDTEVEFYQKLIAHIREKAERSTCTVKIINAKGVGNYKNRVCRIFENGIKKQYSRYQYIVALCYDTDVFSYNKKPPVKWNEVNNDLLKKGANRVIHIRADKSIEDWFLYDIEGLRKFLKISQTVDPSLYKGQNGLVRLFNQANRAYLKGKQSKEMIDALDMNKIFPFICGEITPLCQSIGVKCSGENELCK